MGLLARSLVTGAFTANAIRPPRGYTSGALAFIPGWLTNDFAPHLLALTAVDTAQALARRRATPAALAVSAATMAGLAHQIRQGNRAGAVLRDALARDLGPEWTAYPEAMPTRDDLAIDWRAMLNPVELSDRRVQVLRDVSYFADAGARGTLDLRRPANRPVTNAPVLLQVHGGGWILGSKNEQGIPLVDHMARRGWVTVSINYRLAPRSYFPAQVVDVKRAIAWIRDHITEYGGDPGFVAITGGSAGGHLTALTALTPNHKAYQPGFEDADTSVQAAIPLYGVYDFAGTSGLPRSTAMRDGFLGPRVIGATWEEHPEVYREGSPLLRVTEEAPDFFVIHGTPDSLTPVEPARLFVEELRRRSRRTVVYAELPGAQHAFDIFRTPRTAHVVNAVDQYLSWQVARHRRVAAG